MIKSFNLDAEVYDEAARIHKFHGYHSLSNLVNQLLKEWIEQNRVKAV